MMSRNPSPPSFYSIREIADHLLVCDKTVRRWIERGDLVAHRIGHQWRIAAADLETFLKLRRIQKP